MRRSVAASLLAGLTIIVVLLSVGSVRLDSATSDEPAYIAAGMIKLTAGRLDFFRDQPPLMNSISAAPLVVAGYEMPAIWKVGDSHWAVGKFFLFRSGYDGHRMLFLARLPTIVLFVGLCFAAYFFVVAHSGSRAWGIAAFAMIGFCPNLMAHGRLATVDMALSFFSFVAVALFVAMLKRPLIPLAIGVGVASSAAALSKTSGNILGVVFVVLLIIFRPREKRFYVCLLVAAIAAIAVLEIVVLAEGSDAYVQANFPDMPRIGVPFAEFFANLEAIRGWYEQGHDKPQFLFGEFSTRGWWYYYPVALALKLTIPALLFIAGGLALTRRANFGVVACLVFVALFMLVASRAQLALGIRYVLPVIPFLYAAAAILLSTVKMRSVRWLLAALIVAHGTENIAAYPSYIGYFNQFIGSHRNADRYLIDSNLDWGQDLRRLDAWCEKNGVEAIALHYFGGADPEFDLRRRIIGGYGPGGPPLPKGYFALSRHIYRVSFSPMVSRVNYDTYLAASRARYLTTIGDSIMVFRIE